jgi:hypothetical protein
VTHQNDHDRTEQPDIPDGVSKAEKEDRPQNGTYGREKNRSCSESMAGFLWSHLLSTQLFFESLAFL